MTTGAHTTVWTGVTDARDPGGRLTRVIELRRPEKLNCLSLAMLDELLAALEGCAADRIILAGAGRSFCSGLDLNEVAAPGGSRAHLERLVRVYRQLLTAQVPSLVLARGYAVGGGAGLAVCARTVVAASDIRLRLPGGNLARLAAVVIPVCRLRAQGRLPAGGAWLGCELNARAAQQLGLVDKLVSPEQLEAFLHEARRGATLPQWWDAPPRHEGAAVERALRELEDYLNNF